MKKIICLLMIIVLTGCGVKYQINIKDDSVEETIDVSTLIIKNQSSNAVEVDYDSMEFIDSIRNMNIPAINNSTSSFYEKEITNDGNLYNISLSYEYKKDDYVNSRTINQCFENHKVEFDGNKAYIHLSGKFKCYDGEDIEIIISSPNKVLKTNGKKSGNSYKWVINKDNYDNIDIEFKTSGMPKGTNTILIIVCLIVFAGISIFVIDFILKYLRSRNINDI